MLAEQVAGQLHPDKLVVGQILVPALDDPVAIGMGAGHRHKTTSTRVEATDIVVAIAGNVEPVASPSLAVSLRGQEPIDELGPGISSLVGLEGGDLFRCGGQAGEVQCGAADQGQLVGLPGRREALVSQFGQNEMVDIVLRPAAAVAPR